MNSERPLLLKDCTSIYVMWWPDRQLSKVGIALSPHARLSQIRAQKGDRSIIIAAAWNCLDGLGIGSAASIEQQLHAILRNAGLQDSSNPFQSEWFEARWPSVVVLVEQWAQIAAPLGVRLRRMQGVHG